MYSLCLLGLVTLFGVLPASGAIEKRAAFDYELPEPKDMFDDVKLGPAELLQQPDLYDYSASLEKRAPMGFHGMRGKKKTANGLMGFVGTRGKKFDHTNIPEDQLLDIADAYYEKRGPNSAFFGVRGKKAPSGSNFFGVRGKKAPSGSNFFGVRGKKAPSSGFVGMRGKKCTEESRIDDLISTLQNLDMNGPREKRDTSLKTLSSYRSDSQQRQNSFVDQHQNKHISNQPSTLKSDPKQSS